MKKMGLMLASLAVAGLVSASAFAIDAPPLSRTVDVSDHPFGIDLPDPYRWMENDHNEEFNAWLSAEGSYARAQLDAAPQLAQWHTRLKAVSEGTRITRLQQRAAGRIFFVRQDNGKGGVLMVRDAGGRERVLLDPQTVAAGKGHANITQFTPSPNGKLVAVNVDSGGTEVTAIEILNADNGKRLPDTIEHVWGEFAASWQADSAGFAYTQMSPPKEGADPIMNMHARYHRLGKDVGKDPVLLTHETVPGIALTEAEFPQPDLSQDSDFAFVSAGAARKEFRLCAARKTDVIKNLSRANWNCLADYSDMVTAFGVHGNTLYLLSNKDAPNGRVLAVDLAVKHPSLASAQVVVAESEQSVLTNLVIARDGLYFSGMHDGMNTFARLTWGARKAEPLSLPFDGAGPILSSEPKADGVLVALQSWTRPNTAFAYDAAKGVFADLNLGTTSPGSYGDIEALETVATSADGTAIPLSIVHRKDVKLDGNNLTLLMGYGGYGISMQPKFDPIVLEWVKSGHVYAVAHVRGGGEKGDAWYLGGKSANKHKGVEDFVACAQTLVKLGYTSPERTAAYGGSAGGVLVGGAITYAPSQFGAAVVHAGILNPTRLMTMPNGVNQIPEMGDPREAAGLRALADMDPYEHVRTGTAYPAVMLAVGINDSRVAPWNSGKFGARLQAATASGKPVWFRTNGDAGHFTDSLDDTASEKADIYTFLEMQLH